MSDHQDSPQDKLPRTRLCLPAPPAELRGPVKAWRQSVEILTYAPERPDIHPMFLERRVYQGSSGRVYPLPFCDRISIEPTMQQWDAIHIENEFLRVMILPEIGGRIHVGFDKRNGYDFFYRQNVIRPALVGLAGPWISGGVEFNWPQHHRPATFMPMHAEIEHHPDGAATVWCSDHDPMLRMKGMHGISLLPDCARLDLKVRLYNRTPYTQTFLWWANVATRVHEQYQSFFPTDVSYVADHAKRAVTSFPLSDRPYYGVDYPERARNGIPTDEKPRQFVPDGSYALNDLSWYSNIPVPTSYMISHTEEDFFGGYDHARNAGVVHVANHHVVPGKKQWTWGNHEFGYAWDRNLTLEDGPYIELMAGAYTDNQPDFSFLAPWETKSFMQSWFPIFGIGVPQTANKDAALRLEAKEGVASVGVQVTRNIEQATVILRVDGKDTHTWQVSLSVHEPFRKETPIPDVSPSSVSVEVLAEDRTLIAYDPSSVRPADAPVVATAPAAPEDIASVEELYLTGLHLHQYRHATRDPEPYWREALSRDPKHSDSLNALGLWHLRRGEFDLAAECFEAAILRLTLRNPNPRNGEPLYNLGIVERFRGQAKKAYDAFYKATWNAAWRAPAYYALAEIDCTRGDWETALEHLNRCLAVESQQLNARNLKVAVLQILGRQSEADSESRTIKTLDPLDLHSRWREGHRCMNGNEVLDLAFDFVRSGQLAAAEQVLEGAAPAQGDGSLPMVFFTLAHVRELQGKSVGNARALANETSLDYCFPSRLEEQLILQDEIKKDPSSVAAKYLLGLLWYHHRRYNEAIDLWNSAAQLHPEFATVWRNLGIARFNIEKDTNGAMDAFDRALAADPTNARAVYERDQLWKRTATAPIRRLTELQRHLASVQSRDDLTIELATLLNQVGQPGEALKLLLGRPFQPWEGGEGMVLQQYVRSRVLLARQCLIGGQEELALEHLQAAVNPPENLSEAKHLLANWSHVDYWLGFAHSSLGNDDMAKFFWSRAARQRGDFQQMAVLHVSTMTYWTGMSQLRLGQREEARLTFQQIRAHSEHLMETAPTIDYFATSLPAMLLFQEDLSLRNHIDALFLRAQAALGLSQVDVTSNDEARSMLENVLKIDPNHADAADLLSELRRELAAQ